MDIFLAEDCHIIHQTVPDPFSEFRNRPVLLFQFCEEHLYFFTPCQFLSNGKRDGIHLPLHPVETLRQAIIPFLVFALVEGNAGVLVNALLYHPRYHVQLFLQPRFLPFKLSRGKGGIRQLILRCALIRHLL